MNLNSFMEARLGALQEREERERIYIYRGEPLIHISELAACPWVAFLNALRGQAASQFDIQQSSKVAFGEALEELNLHLLLIDNGGEYKLAHQGPKRIPLRDSHSGKSPTFVYDPAYRLGGRCDAVLSHQRRWEIFESKSINETSEKLLYELWFRGIDIAEYIAQKSYDLWWTWPYLRQVVGYIHCASITYKRKIRRAVISILGKGTGMPFRFMVDLDDERYCEMAGGTWGEYYRAMLDTLLYQAQLIKEALELGYQRPPEQLYKALCSKFCANCGYLKECKPEFPEMEIEEDVTERMPELGIALEEFYDSQGGKKAEEVAKGKLKERMMPLFDKIPEEKGDVFRRVVRFKDSIVKGVFIYQDDSVRELKDHEHESGIIVVRKGGPRLHVTAEKIKEE